MRRSFIVLLSCLLMSAGIAAAADVGEMFPANLNDSWALERFGESEANIRVTAIDQAGWHRFEGLFDMTLMLWPRGDQVYAWRDGRAAMPQLLYDFAAPLGAAWHVDLRGLRGHVTVAEKDAKVDTAFGPLEACTAFDFLWETLDAGIETQWFCPGIGLVKQTETTIAGPAVEYTRAAAIGGDIMIGYVGQGMNVRIDQGKARSGSVLKARLEMWDTTGTRRPFHSATTQLFDVALVDQRGQVVRLWSWDKSFDPVPTTWILDGEEDFEADLPLLNRKGLPLPPGLYTVEGWIIDRLPRPGAKTQVRVY